MSEPIMISADWWTLVGALQADLARDAFEGRVEGVTGRPDGDGYSLSITVPGSAKRIRISFQPVADGTMVAIVAQDDASYWSEKIDFLSSLAAFAVGARRQVAPTAEDLIERYYRSRAAGSKVTLRQLAKEYGFNATYLSQVKRQYDDAGKWGSKA